MAGIMSQDEINTAMIRHAREGRSVVRLKGGDPMIFARASEELAALESAGVPYEIVPGITAAQAASSHAGIPLTDRDDASCVALVTGQESSEKHPDAAPLDYDALARFPGTLVFYMGVTTAPDWSRALIERRQRSDARPSQSCDDVRCRIKKRSTPTLASCRTLFTRRNCAHPQSSLSAKWHARRTIELVHVSPAVWFAQCLSRGPDIKPMICRQTLRNLGANVLGPARDRDHRAAAIGRRSTRSSLALASSIGWSSPAAMASSIFSVGCMNPAATPEVLGTRAWPQLGRRPSKPWPSTT